METLDFTSNLPSGQVIRGTAVRIRLPGVPRRYYRHGWQSWSLAAWIDADYELPIQKPYLLHPMQLDPAYALRRGHHGSWVGAVEMNAGEVVLLGSLGLDAHVALEGRDLVGRYESDSGDWFIAHGDQLVVFSQYAAELARRFGTRTPRAAPRVWCSWYGLYTAINESLLGSVFRSLGDLPFDVFQVDDGWQAKIGDWVPNRKFPSGMQALADRIRSTGRNAGLWLAPLIAVKSSRLFREHPGWFLRGPNGRLVSAGFGWGEQLYAVDTTHPAALEWLAALMKQVRAWGFDYIKLDFLYAGALPGRRSGDVPREQAYREGLHVLRRAMGNDAFFLACGAPILPSLGICDALRAGPDVAAGWENERDAVLLHNPAIPGTRNAIRTTLHRVWLKPLVHVDPDVVYFRSVECALNPEQKHLLQSLAVICDFKATSDLPQWLSPEEREQLRDFLEATPRIDQNGARGYRFDGNAIDYSSALDIPGAPVGWNAVESAALGWLANHPWALRIDDWLQKRSLKKKSLEWG
ncbi:MAG TPA: glycoside hydrolase family 36 protein, partial [Anaerolineales bacterium]